MLSKRDNDFLHEFFLSFYYDSEGLVSIHNRHSTIIIGKAKITRRTDLSAGILFPCYGIHPP